MATGASGSILDILRRFIPFDQMGQEHLVLLAERLRLAYYPKHEVLGRPEDGPTHKLRIIKQGRIQGRIPGNGEGAGETVWDKGPGEVVNVSALLSNQPVRTVHVAVEDTFCFELERDDFDLVMERSSVFRAYMTDGARAMEHLLGQQVRAASLQQLADDLPLTAPLRSFVRRAPVTCGLETSIRDAFATMTEARVGSVAVLDGAGHPRGILTLRDILPRVVLPGRPLDGPVAAVMTPDPVHLGPDATAADAVMLMARNGISHLCVVEDGKVTGVVSERDLFALQRVSMVHLIRAILDAPDIATLSFAAGNIHKLVDQLLAQGVGAQPLVRIITALNDHTAARAIALVLASHGSGLPDFTWLAFGSEGRREQTLKTDQDNGIVFDAPNPASAREARRSLLPVAGEINHALAQCGFALCKGNIMAGSPECCLSLEEWRRRYGDWIDQGSPEHLLKANIFFDVRPLFGKPERAGALWEAIAGNTTRNARFLHQMTANALLNRPPLGLVSDFLLSTSADHPHTLDLKLQGCSPLVDGARVIALRHGIRETNTGDRFRAAMSMGTVPSDEAEAWAETFDFVLLLRMRLHRRQAHQGMELSNHLDPNDMNELDRRMLKEAFRQAGKLQSRLGLDYSL